jgi:drug/metabolite transporter (DMT)-like permease
MPLNRADQPPPNPLHAAPDGSSSRFSPITRGIGWTVVSGLLFVGVTATVRHVGSDVNPVQAAFIRYAFGILLMAPFFLRHGLPSFNGRHIRLNAFRGLVHGIGVMLWFFAMTQIPIADVTAIGFTSPIFVTIGAALLLGEKFRLRRLVAIVIAFFGMLIIIRPGLVEVEIGAIAQLIAAPLFAVSMLIAKMLSKDSPPQDVVAYMSIFVTLTLLPPAIYFWQTPTWTQVAWLLCTSVFATAGHVALTKAYQLADITVTQSISFLQLVWAAMLGYLLFAETPDVWTIVGGGVIVASATYIAHREARLARAS